MKRLRSFVALTMAVLMASAAFSGCRNSGDQTSSAGSAGGGSKTKVVLWNQKFEDWNQKFFTKECEEYNKQSTKYSVDQQFIAGDAWTEKMKAAQAANQAPDSYVMAYNAIALSAKDATIQPLNDLLPQSSWDDLNDNVKEMISYQGKYYAYPQLLEPSALLYYRKDLFQSAGISAAPKTWAELLEAAKKLTTNDVFGLEIQGFGDAWTFWGWEQQAAGHQAVSDDWSKATCTDQGFIDLANFFKSLYTEKVVPQQPLAGYTDILPFGKGEVAMQICGSWAIAELKNTYPDMVDKTEVAPVTHQGRKPGRHDGDDGRLVLRDRRQEQEPGRRSGLHPLASGGRSGQAGGVL